MLKLTTERGQSADQEKMMATSSIKDRDAMTIMKKRKRRLLVKILGQIFPRKNLTPSNGMTDRQKRRIK